MHEAGVRQVDTPASLRDEFVSQISRTRARLDGHTTDPTASRCPFDDLLPAIGTGPVEQDLAPAIKNANLNRILMVV